MNLKMPTSKAPKTADKLLGSVTNPGTTKEEGSAGPKGLGALAALPQEGAQNAGQTTRGVESPEAKNARLTTTFCALVAEGLDGATCRQILAESRTPDELAYVQAAEGKARDGELEVDESDAAVSLGDDPGAYVQCWMWVTSKEAGVKHENDNPDLDDGGED